MFNLIDRLVGADFGQRGMAPLFEAARAQSARPLCQAAAQYLTTLQAGDPVIFLTGSIVRGWVSPALAETDGPIGVAALARVLNFGFNAIPIVLTDPSLVPAVAATMEAAGLTVVARDTARAAAANIRFTGVAVVETGASVPAEAKRHAAALLDDVKPRAVIAVERSGMTGDGTFRNSVGQNTSEGRALLDYVVLEAQARGVPTIGIGDLGNEIGMGAVREAVVRHIPDGARVCAAVGTDVVFPCGVSNWGCYAIQAALAMLTRRIEFAHTPQLEQRLLTAAVRIGLVDGLHGTREPTVDGLPGEVHLAIVQLLHSTAQRGIAFQNLHGAQEPVYEIEQLAHFRKLMR